MPINITARFVICVTSACIPEFKKTGFSRRLLELNVSNAYPHEYTACGG
jgi:hypothetical protein